MILICFLFSGKPGNPPRNRGGGYGNRLFPSCPRQAVWYFACDPILTCWCHTHSGLLSTCWIDRTTRWGPDHTIAIGVFRPADWVPDGRVQEQPAKGGAENFPIMAQIQEFRTILAPVGIVCKCLRLGRLGVSRNGVARTWRTSSYAC